MSYRCAPALLPALVWAALALAGCGEEPARVPPRPSPHAHEAAPEPPAVDPQPADDEPVDLEATWARLVPFRRPVAPDGRVRDVVHIRLGGAGADELPDHLAGIELPAEPTKQDVRVYVGAILCAARDARGGFGSQDAEVTALARVGPEHVDVLIEPLEHVPLLDGSLYLVQAMERLMTEGHKDLILEHLGTAHELVELVVARGWTRDAAPTLFAALRKRGGYLSCDMILAAASVADPEHYELLKYHLRHNSNHYDLWQALRKLPGIGPLEPSVRIVWRSTPREEDSFAWGQLAMVLAHYGEMEGLEHIVVEMEQYEPAWMAFQHLTGYGQDIEILWERDYREARAWFEAHKDRLVFDADAERYVVRAR